MIYISAGHHNLDAGAIGVKGVKEADLTKIQRDLTCIELDKLGAKYQKDNDNWTLAEYLKKIVTTPKDVTIEFHFNSFNSKATGAETIISDYASQNSINFAKELNEAVVKILGIADRGVKKEKESHRGKLGLMRENGIVALVELCFLDNVSDLSKWEANNKKLAVEFARIIKKYDDLLT